MRVMLKEGREKVYNYVKEGIVYGADTTDGGVFIKINGINYMGENFDVIEEAPKLYRSSNETPDEILEWYGNNCSDSPVEMSKEIHMLRGALHDLKRELSEKIGPALAVMDLGKTYVKTVEKLIEASEKEDKG